MAPPKSARTRSVGTKLTEEEYALLEAATAKGERHLERDPLVYGFHQIRSSGMSCLMVCEMVRKTLNKHENIGLFRTPNET